MTLDEELNDCKAELNITDYALTLACEHIAKENTLLYSIVGATLKRLVKDYFVRNAKMLLEVRRFTENENDT